MHPLNFAIQSVVLICYLNYRMDINFGTFPSEVSDKWKTGSLCRIGLFKENEISQKNYKWIWTKSLQQIESRKWSWKNPGLGDWEIRLGLKSFESKDNIRILDVPWNVPTTGKI